MSNNLEVILENLETCVNVSSSTDTTENKMGKDLTAARTSSTTEQTCIISEADTIDDLQQEETEEIVLFNDQFYVDAKLYWETIEPTVKGMLGGFDIMHNDDIKESRNFLNTLFKLKLPPGKRQALDCGAGIGRITKFLLMNYFDSVDLVEQDKKFADSVKHYIGNVSKLGCVYNEGLQDFVPEPKKYDIIWCQWVLGHLTDHDLIDFFKRCAIGLKKNGVLVLKENVTSNDCIQMDRIDSSVTRPLPMLKRFIVLANLRILKIRKQINIPKGLFSVYMIAVRSM